MASSLYQYPACLGAANVIETFRCNDVNDIKNILYTYDIFHQLKSLDDWANWLSWSKRSLSSILAAVVYEACCHDYYALPAT